MPHNGVSTEFLETLDDDIAEFIVAQEHVRDIRRMFDLLYERKHIQWRYKLDADDSLDHIAAALLTGKKNTAQLRRVTP